MEGLNHAELLKSIIRHHASLRPTFGEVEPEIAFDEEHGHYSLFYVGWQDWKRVHGVVIHADLRDGKIWIQHDGTETGIANELVAAGVPRDQIVLAWQHPFKRKLGEFAAA